MLEDAIRLNQKPFLLHQQDDSLFYIVEFLKRGEGGLYEMHLKVQGLIPGQHIKETPTDGLRLAVIYLHGADQFIEVVKECRKQARISWHDYVAVDYPKEFNMVLSLRHPHLMVFVTPRLFNPIEGFDFNPFI